MPERHPRTSLVTPNLQMALVPVVIWTLALSRGACGAPVETPSTPYQFSFLVTNFRISTSAEPVDDPTANKWDFAHAANKGLYLGFNTVKLGGAAALFLLTLIGVEKMTRWAFMTTKEAVGYWSNELKELKNKGFDSDQEDLARDSDGWDSPLIEKRSHPPQAREVNWTRLE